MSDLKNILTMSNIVKNILNTHACYVVFSMSGRYNQIFKFWGIKKNIIMEFGIKKSLRSDLSSFKGQGDFLGTKKKITVE